MSSYSSLNTLIGTFSSIDAINTRTIDSSNLICIDTSNNRIGINTINPLYSIHIADNSNSFTGIYTPRLYFDLSKLPQVLVNTGTRGEVFYDNSGYLRVKL
uniref:Uncharacterized protein n=1 Tax=viral metagenome TaxID=1070528 RepID=A0A6C0D616_9ZZZZ